MTWQKVGAGFGVMILKNNKVLLGKRHEDPSKADSELCGEGTWTMPGGKLEFHESFEEGAVREVLEETSIKLKKVQVMCVSNDMADTAHFVTIGLLAEEFEGEPKVMEPDEITEWQWFDLDNLPKNIFPPSVKVLHNYHKQTFYSRPKNIEVEIRSFISQEKYSQLLEFFRNHARLIKEDSQETHYFDCEQDLRIQKNNYGSKIWMKKGKIHDDAREEIEIKTTHADFDNLQALFSNLGYNVEIKWLRDRKQFEWDEIKVCLDYTKGYGYIIELEKIGTEENKEQILGELKRKLNELNIPLTPKEEFNEKFDYYKQNWRELI